MQNIRVEEFRQNVTSSWLVQNIRVKEFRHHMTSCYRGTNDVNQFEKIAVNSWYNCTEYRIRTETDTLAVDEIHAWENLIEAGNKQPQANPNANNNDRQIGYVRC